MPSFTFRVQALGGKFLADDIGGAWVTVKDAGSGVLLAEGPTRGDSGNLVPTSSVSPAQIASASKSVIAVADGSSAWWLVPDEGSSAFGFGLELAAPRQVDVLVRGPVGGLQSAGEVRTRMWLSPSEALTPADSPGHVVLLPGLLVQALEPAIHTAVEPGAMVNFAAKVTMMCGCQIASGGYWPAGDFEVAAIVQEVVKDGLGGPVSARMGLLGGSSAPPSTFSTVPTVQPFNVPATGKGTVYYQATISAWQKSTGNTGSATVNFYCTYPSG